MTTYAAYLEPTGTGDTQAYAVSWPGCRAQGATPAAALAALPDAIRRYAVWLRGHNESVALLEPITVAVASPVGERPGAPTGLGGLYAEERRPLSGAALETALRWAGYTQADLLAQVTTLSPATLDRPGPWGGWSIRMILHHIAESEGWYLDRLRVVPDTTAPLAPELSWADKLDLSRRRVAQQLRALTPDQRSAIYYPTHGTDYPAEGWTARKVLRRLIEHEWEHLGQIRALLAAPP